MTTIADEIVRGMTDKSGGVKGGHLKGQCKLLCLSLEIIYRLVMSSTSTESLICPVCFFILTLV